MTVWRLPARIPAEEAAHTFTRPRWGNLFGLLARPARQNAAVASVECVWMPVYALCLAFSSSKGPGTIWISVDACSGVFALFERIEELREGIPEGDVFPPLLDEAAAETAARKGLVAYMLRRRGRKGQSLPEALIECRLYHTPVWAYYFRRWGRVDLAVLDGYTGSLCGGQMRIAVVNAMIAKHKAGMSL